MLTIQELLRLKTMYDADKGGAGNGQPTDDNPEGREGKEGQGEGDNPEGSNEGEPQDTPEGKDNTKTFTQEELDRIIADRLARERKKQADEEQRIRDEEERKRLEEEGEYKELADKRQKEIERLQAIVDEQKTERINAKKETALIQAGYSAEQVELLSKTLTGETDEELAEEVKKLTDTIPTKPIYADPSSGNGAKDKPKKTDLNQKGKSMFQRLKEKGKVK
jgi:hypothetical protein